MFARTLYSFLFYCITPLILLRVLWRSIKEPSYRTDLQQRFGFVNNLSHQEKPIWVHAVSAGETIAAVPLIEILLKAGHEILLSNMTPTGRERAQALLGDRVSHCYAPYDMPLAVKKFVLTVRPSALIVIDTELWPNIVHTCFQQGLPMYLVNARLSEKSATGYKKISLLAEPMLKKLTRVFAQSEIQGQRFLRIGLPKSNLSISGSIKFDASLPPNFVEKTALLERQFAGRYCLLAASTHEGEEAMVLNACELAGFFIEAERPAAALNVCLILAPRHPHRADHVEALCKEKGLNVIRHSTYTGKQVDTSVQVYIVDTMGDLIYFYSLAGVAFVGGSLVDIGGHNPMEPASLGVPTIMGQFRRNIQDIAEQFIDAGAMLSVGSELELKLAFLKLVEDPTLRQQMSASGLEIVKRNSGALDRVANEILEQLH